MRFQIPPKVLSAMMQREVVLAALVAAVASAVLLAYRIYNPDRAAENYFAAHASEGAHNRAAYRLMQICYVVIISAAAFNLRFVVFEVARPAIGAIVRRVGRRPVV